MQSYLKALLVVSFPFISIPLQAQYFSSVSDSVGLNHVSILVSEIYPTQGGAAWFDYDNDGWVDLYLTGGKSTDKFYRNNGNGSFTDKTIEAGFSMLDTSIYTMGVISGDINNDGHRDLLVTTDKRTRNYLFLNNGNSTFTDISLSAGIMDTAESSSAAFGDYNEDGFLDIFISNWCKAFVMNPIPLPPYPAYPNLFYINNGDNTFTERASDFGMDDTLSASLGVMFSDYDNDNDVDLLIANDFGHLDNEENELFRNEYPLNDFTNMSSVSNFDWGMNGMGIAKGDYDEDGDLDYFVTNIKRNVLMRNNGDGTFDNVIDGTGLENDSAMVGSTGLQHRNVSWGTGFLDYDHDTDLDLYVVNGDLNFHFPYPTLDSNKLFQNDGTGSFIDVTDQMGVGDPYMSRGFAAGDYDNDGDLDFLVPIVDSVVGNKNVLLYRNHAANGNWLKVNLEGTVSNRDGYGAKVYAVVGGRKLMRECDGGSSFISHHSTTIHFGLGSYSTIDSLIVEWPSGYINYELNVATNQTVAFVEAPVITNVPPSENLKVEIYPNPFLSEIKVNSSETIQEVSIYTKEGKLVFNEHIPHKGDFTISSPELSDLAAGVYFIKITGLNNTFQKDLIKVEQ